MSTLNISVGSILLFLPTKGQVHRNFNICQSFALSFFLHTYVSENIRGYT